MVDLRLNVCQQTGPALMICHQLLCYILLAAGAQVTRWVRALCSETESAFINRSSIPVVSIFVIRKIQLYYIWTFLYVSQQTYFSKYYDNNLINRNGELIIETLCRLSCHMQIGVNRICFLNTTEMATLLTAYSIHWSLFYYWLAVLTPSYGYVDLDIHMCCASKKENTRSSHAHRTFLFGSHSHIELSVLAVRMYTKAAYLIRSDFSSSEMFTVCKFDLQVFAVLLRISPTS